VPIACLVVKRCNYSQRMAHIMLYNLIHSTALPTHAPLNLLFDKTDNHCYRRIYFARVLACCSVRNSLLAFSVPSIFRYALSNRGLVMLRSTRRRQRMESNGVGLPVSTMHSRAGRTTSVIEGVCHTLKRIYAFNVSLTIRLLTARPYQTI